MGAQESLPDRYSVFEMTQSNKSEQGPRHAREMREGTQVKRGPDWCDGDVDDEVFGGQGERCLGTVVKGLHDGMVEVLWDNGNRSGYCMGAGNMYRLQLAFVQQQHRTFPTREISKDVTPAARNTPPPPYSSVRQENTSPPPYSCNPPDAEVVSGAGAKPKEHPPSSSPDQKSVKDDAALKESLPPPPPPALTPMSFNNMSVQGPLHAEEMTNPGTRVRRGPSWAGGDEDGGPAGAGSVEGYLCGEGKVRVRWDTGSRNTYCVGHGKYEVQLTRGPMDVKVMEEGTRVVTGADWYKELGHPTEGIVTKEPHVWCGGLWVHVQWKSIRLGEDTSRTVSTDGTKRYRVGHEGKYEVQVADILSYWCPRDDKGGETHPLVAVSTSCEVLKDKENAESSLLLDSSSKCSETNVFANTTAQEKCPPPLIPMTRTNMSVQGPLHIKEMKTLGTRVRRGPSWNPRQKEDGGASGEGSVVRWETVIRWMEPYGGSVIVEWDKSKGHNTHYKYEMGTGGRYELQLASSVLNTRAMKRGTRVKPGPDWTVDLGYVKEGVVVKEPHDWCGGLWVHVLWDHQIAYEDNTSRLVSTSSTRRYRMGHDGKYEVELSDTSFFWKSQTETALPASTKSEAALPGSSRPPPSAPPLQSQAGVPDEDGVKSSSASSSKSSDPKDVANTTSQEKCPPSLIPMTHTNMSVQGPLHAEGMKTVGARVRRGPSWNDYQTEDGGPSGKGSVVRWNNPYFGVLTVIVEWDKSRSTGHGIPYRYDMGSGGRYELQLVSSFLNPKAMKQGVRVKPGPDWSTALGMGNVEEGTIVKEPHDWSGGDWVHVLWDDGVAYEFDTSRRVYNSGTPPPPSIKLHDKTSRYLSAYDTRRYRVGHDGKYEVQLSDKQTETVLPDSKEPEAALPAPPSAPPLQSQLSQAGLSGGDEDDIQLAIALSLSELKGSGPPTDSGPSTEPGPSDSGPSTKSGPLNSPSSPCVDEISNSAEASNVQNITESSDDSQDLQDISAETSHHDASLVSDALKRLQRENEELKESKLCVICVDAERTIMFLNCGHLVCCEKCSERLRDCPMCRRRIEKKIRAFID